MAAPSRTIKQHHKENVKTDWAEYAPVVTTEGGTGTPTFSSQFAHWRRDGGFIYLRVVLVATSWASRTGWVGVQTPVIAGAAIQIQNPLLTFGTRLQIGGIYEGDAGVTGSSETGRIWVLGGTNTGVGVGSIPGNTMIVGKKISGTNGDLRVDNWTLARAYIFSGLFKITEWA